MRILLTTTSFQDTPGPHHAYLEGSGFEIVRARGPLEEGEILKLVTEGGGVDGLLNGDDRITAAVIDAGLPRLKVIAKYGIGLDSIDVPYATSKRLPVLYTPGVNHTTVAEHTFGLMIALAKHFLEQVIAVRAGQWKRITGTELAGKTLAVLGLGRIGKEVVKRAVAFEMKPIGYDVYWDQAFADRYGVRRCGTAEEAMKGADVVSLHLNLSKETEGLIDRRRIEMMKKGALLVNTARGGLVNEADVAEACKSGRLGGYGTDVLVKEPMVVGHVFQGLENVVVTPHVGSRTFESVERQAMRAARNLVNFLTGGEDFVQANPF